MRKWHWHFSVCAELIAERPQRALSAPMEPGLLRADGAPATRTTRSPGGGGSVNPLQFRRRLQDAQVLLRQAPNPVDVCVAPGICAPVSERFFCPMCPVLPRGVRSP